MVAYSNFREWRELSLLMGLTPFVKSHVSSSLTEATWLPILTKTAAEYGVFYGKDRVFLALSCA